MNLLFILLLYILIPLFKFRMKEEDKKIDLETDTVNDYSVFLRGFPSNTSEEEVRTFIEDTYFGGKHTIFKMCKAYKIDEYIETEKKIEELLKKMFSLEILKKMKKSTLYDAKIDELKAVIEMRMERKKKLDHMIKANKGDMFLGDMLVSFHFIGDAELIMKKTHQSTFEFTMACCRRKCRYKDSELTSL